MKEKRKTKKLSNTLNSPHFQFGNQRKIAVVFSCPGQEEEKQGRPVSGQTGKNLEVLLELLFENKVLDKKLQKKDLRITNAWDKVLFKSNNLKKRTEATLTEIYSENNLKRVKDELDDIEEIIICFGKKADKALGKPVFADFNATIISCCHLSLQALNSIKYLKKDVLDNPIESGEAGNTHKRLEVLARRIKAEFKSKL